MEPPQEMALQSENARVARVAISVSRQDRAMYVVSSQELPKDAMSYLQLPYAMPIRLHQAFKIRQPEKLPNVLHVKNLVC